MHRVTDLLLRRCIGIGTRDGSRPPSVVAGLFERRGTVQLTKTLVARSTMASIPCSRGFEAIVVINGHVLQDRHAATIVGRVVSR
jgi:hypothetical protein